MRRLPAVSAALHFEKTVAAPSTRRSTYTIMLTGRAATGSVRCELSATVQT